MKLNQEQKNEIRKLHEQGIPFRKIAARFGISYSTAHYYSSEEVRKKHIANMVERFRNKSLFARRVFYKKRLPYIRDYIRKKYQTNQEFRENEIKRVGEYVRGRKK